MHKSNLIPKVMVVVLVAQSSPTLCNPMDHARILCPWDFPGKNTGVSCHFLLQVVFPTRVLNTHCLHWQADSLPLAIREALLHGSQHCHSEGACITQESMNQAMQGHQDKWVIVKSSDKMWSTEEGNGNPLLYSCLENHMDSMKSQTDMMQEEVTPRSEGD